MTGKEEFEPLDELFRKTFQDLPATPTASGWDTPSPRVWQRVQSQINPASTGWALQTWALLAAAAVIVAVGLYFAFGRTEPAPLPTPLPVEQPIAQPPAVESAPTETAPAASVEKPAAKPSGKVRPAATGTRPTPAVNSSTPRGEENRSGHQAVPLPGSKPAAPNSTEREKDGKGN
ncbi:MAG: hypothetical protein LH618_06050 [Saprospiraceae bacterium]|nr:hypothetical protein [Saprospiraceae bacterium]